MRRTPTTTTADTMKAIQAIKMTTIKMASITTKELQVSNNIKVNAHDAVAILKKIPRLSAILP